MKSIALFVFCAGCTLGPRYVTVPMATSAPVAPLITDPGDGTAPDDVEQPAPEDLAGEWNGRVWQGGKSWLITVTFERRGTDVVAHARYPDQRCRADVLMRSTTPRHWTGEENVTVDPLNRCPNHGHVSLEAYDETTLSWRWNGPGGAASASLVRAQPRDD